MISLENLSCQGLINDTNLSLEATCNLQTQQEIWPLLFQGLGVLATLAAVLVALHQARIARKSAVEANEVVIKQQNNMRLRQASRVVAWIANDPRTGKSHVHVENGSDDPIYNVVVGDDQIPGQQVAEYQIIRAGERVDVGLVNDPCAYKQGTEMVVFIKFDDPLGHVYIRDPRNDAGLYEYGRCLD